MRLSVADNGDGVPGGTPLDGFGLPALRQRAEALGGALRAGSGGDGPDGFLLEVELPAGDLEDGAS